ncbi:MAG: hypothetical protein ACI4GA_07245 [Acutalibacteraceae bacterium]|nr:hypothetical protein [Oscillospiraceae bacterium]
MIYKENFNEEMRSYFDKLPVFLQEDIMQSSAKIETLDELKAITANITKGSE